MRDDTEAYKGPADGAAAEAAIDAAKQKFERLVRMQLDRVRAMGEGGGFTDYKSLPRIVVGTVPGDGIGPAITGEAARIMAFLLADDIRKGKIEIRNIEGLTIENRVKAGKSIPDDVMAQIKACHVILKGPTETPDAGSGLQNLESANVAMRKALDLFANVRPVKVEAEGIDWTFFRENTEGGYAVGSLGVDVDNDLALDFTVATTEGCRRIIRAAFEFARDNGKTRVTAVTKANIIKTTDGKFLTIFREMAKEYPGIAADDWYIDIMTAKLIDAKRRSGFQVLVMPNLYGDILTDEAAQIQGGVGTAGSANIGKRYAMFEAIHGSAPRMVREGRAAYADPSSIIKAASMLLNHIGYHGLSAKLDGALELCASDESFRVTGNADGVTGARFADRIMEVIGTEAGD